MRCESESSFDCFLSQWHFCQKLSKSVHVCQKIARQRHNIFETQGIGVNVEIVFFLILEVEFVMDVCCFIVNRE